MLGVDGPDAAAAAFERIRAGARGGRRGGAMEASHAADRAAGIECLLGLADDPAFGPLLAFGLGGASRS